MDVVIRLFPVTSTSLSVVFRVCSGFRDGVLGSVCALSSSLFTCGFVNGGVASGFLFRISSLRRVFVDYYFLIEQGWCCVLLQRKRTFNGFFWLQASGMAGSGPADESSNLSRAIFTRCDLHRCARRIIVYWLWDGDMCDG